LFNWGKGGTKRAKIVGTEKFPKAPYGKGKNRGGSAPKKGKKGGVP